MRCLLLGILLLSLIGCGDSTGTVAGPVGTYQLVAADGQPLPYRFLSSELLSGSLTFRTGSAYSAEYTWRDTNIFTGETTAEVETETGSYTHSGTSITLTPDGGFGVVGTFDGSTIELDAAFTILTFRR